MKTDKKELVEFAISETLKNGASSVSAVFKENSNIEISIRKGEIENLKESIQSYLHIDIYVNNRFSSHSTNNFKKESLIKFISEALKGTKYLNADTFRKLPEAKFYKDRYSGDLDLFDKSYSKIDIKDKINFAREIEEDALKRSNKIVSVTSFYGDSSYSEYKMNSNGFKGEKSGTSFIAGVEVSATGKNGARPEDWAYARRIYFSDLPTAKSLAKTAVERTLNKVGQKKINTGKYDIIIENKTVSKVISMLLNALSAKALQQKSTYLEGKKGKKIASEILTITDAPFLKRGLSSKKYDGSGISTKKRTIVEDGILKEFYIDNYYGRKLGLAPTSASATNLIFTPGTQSLEKMISGIKKGILINSFLGGNHSSTTGDFSFGIVGQYIENGVVKYPINEMNITGNAKDFWNTLDIIGTDPYMNSGWQTPSMLFRNASIAGL